MTLGGAATCAPPSQRGAVPSPRAAARSGEEPAGHSRPDGAAPRRTPVAFRPSSRYSRPASRRQRSRSPGGGRSPAAPAARIANRGSTRLAPPQGRGSRAPESNAARTTAATGLVMRPPPNGRLWYQTWRLGERVAGGAVSCDAPCRSERFVRHFDGEQCRLSSALHLREPRQPKRLALAAHVDSLSFPRSREKRVFAKWTDPSLRCGPSSSTPFAAARSPAWR